MLRMNYQPMNELFRLVVVVVPVTTCNVFLEGVEMLFLFFCLLENGLRVFFCF